MNMIKFKQIRSEHKCSKYLKWKKLAKEELKKLAAKTDFRYKCNIESTIKNKNHKGAA